ncbi:MAG: hypothetical protein ACE5FM_04775, partial [Methyloligellaceae bacterium]
AVLRDLSSLAQETPALDVREWTGPTRGMYRHLWFNEVPNQIMPLSPASIVLDLHMILNDLYNKLASQADRQKQVGVVSPSGADDADRIVQAADGEVIKSQHPQATREINFGGPDQTTFAFMLQTKQLFNLFAGNPELLGGSGPQADTLGQDQMNLASANHRVQDMQDTLVVATQQLIQDLAFYIWNEPLEEAQVYKPLKNTRFGARTTFSPENLKGEFLKYRIQIEPYSMQHITPSEKLNRLFMLMERMVFPGLPIFQSQGQVPDMREYLKIAAKYANLESEINDIFRYTGAQPQQGQSQGPPVSPPSPSERRAPANRSTQTQQGQDAALVQRLIGGPLQQSEAQREFAA